MHITKDYSKSIAPKFDALTDVMEWLGKEKWERVTGDMARVLNPHHFGFYAGLAGIEGFPVKAWYDHYHGDGAYTKAFEEYPDPEAN